MYKYYNHYLQNVVTRNQMKNKKKAPSLLAKIYFRLRFYLPSVNNKNYNINGSHKADYEVRHPPKKIARAYRTEKGAERIGHKLNIFHPTRTFFIYISKALCTVKKPTYNRTKGKNRNSSGYYIFGEGNK